MPYYVLESNDCDHGIHCMFDDQYSEEDILLFFKIATDGRGSLTAIAYELDWRCNETQPHTLISMAEYYRWQLELFVHRPKDFAEEFKVNNKIYSKEYAVQLINKLLLAANKGS